MQPLTSKDKEAEAEKFELANETLEAEAAEADKKSSPEDSPKDGGAETAKLEPPEVVIAPATPEPPEVESD